MHGKKLVVSIFGLIILAGLGAQIFFFLKSPQPTQAEPQPSVETATDVSQITPDGAMNLRFFPIGLRGLEELENLIIYDTEGNSGLVHHLEVLQNTGEKWEKMYEKLFPDSQGKIDGVQRVDFQRDGKQEFFVLLTKDKESKYFVLAFENERYLLLEQPAITDAIVGDVIVLGANETEARFVSFKATPEGIQEIYAIMCDREVNAVKQDVPESENINPEDIACRLSSFLVVYDNGQLKRTHVEIKVQPPVTEDELLKSGLQPPVNE